MQSNNQNNEPYSYSEYQPDSSHREVYTAGEYRNEHVLGSMEFDDFTHVCHDFGQTNSGNGDNTDYPSLVHNPYIYESNGRGWADWLANPGHTESGEAMGNEEGASQAAVLGETAGSMQTPFSPSGGTDLGSHNDFCTPSMTYQMGGERPINMQYPSEGDTFAGIIVKDPLGIPRYAVPGDVSSFSQLSLGPGSKTMVMPETPVRTDQATNPTYEAMIPYSSIGTEIPPETTTSPGQATSTSAISPPETPRKTSNDSHPWRVGRLACAPNEKGFGIMSVSKPSGRGRKPRKKPTIKEETRKEQAVEAYLNESSIGGSSTS